MNEDQLQQSIHQTILEPLSDMHLSFEKVTTILGVLYGYFEYNKNYIETDMLARQEYFDNYQNIQSLIDVLGDYIFPMRDQLRKMLDENCEIQSKSA